MGSSFFGSGGTVTVCVGGGAMIGVVTTSSGIGALTVGVFSSSTVRDCSIEWMRLLSLPTAVATPWYSVLRFGGDCV